MVAYKVNPDGSLSGLDAVWSYLGGEWVKYSPLRDIHRAAGATTNDLSVSEAQAFVKEDFPYSSADEYLLHAYETIKDVLRFRELPFKLVIESSGYPVIKGLDLLWNTIDLTGEQGLNLFHIYGAAGWTLDDLTLPEIGKYLAEIAPAAGLFPQDPAIWQYFSPEECSLESAKYFLYGAVLIIGSSYDIRPTDFLPATIAHLKRYGIPTDQKGFHDYIIEKSRQNQKRIREGFLAQLGHYYYRRLTLKERESFQKIAYTPAVGNKKMGAALKKLSELKFGSKLLSMVEGDSDGPRRDLILQEIESIKNAHNLDQIRAAVSLLAEAAPIWWTFHSAKFTTEANPFEGQGLRTTSGFEQSTSLARFFDSWKDIKDLPKGKVRRALIIGPGLSFEEERRQIFEPFALVNALLKNGLADIEDLTVDLLDLNPDVIQHIRVARYSEGYELKLQISDYFNKQKAIRWHFENFGCSLPDVSCNAPVNGNERALNIPPIVLKSFNPIHGDMMTDRFAPDDEYDLIISYNTLIYFDKKDLALAGANIKRVLKRGGVFIANHPSHESIRPEDKFSHFSDGLLHQVMQGVVLLGESYDVYRGEAEILAERVIAYTKD